MSQKSKSATKKKTNTAKKRNLKGKKDARVDHRIPIQLLVDYKCEGNYLFDFCRDLGTGGVFIGTSKPLPVGKPIDLTFTIPDSKETLEAKGTVIWVQSSVPGKELTPGMGVQFEAFSPKQRQTLEEFLLRYKAEEQRLLDAEKTA